MMVLAPVPRFPMALTPALSQRAREQAGGRADAAIARCGGAAALRGAAQSVVAAHKKAPPAWLGLEGPYQVNSVVCLLTPVELPPLDRRSVAILAATSQRSSGGGPSSIRPFRKSRAS